MARLYGLLTIGKYILIAVNLAACFDCENICDSSNVMETTITKGQLYYKGMPKGGVPKGIRTLAIRGNIGQIDKYSLEKLTDIEILDLSQCNISDIKPNAFEEMIKIKTINLSHNRIEFINDDCFSQLQSLEELYLNTNEMKVIMDGSLRNLISLTVLDISNNGLLEIPRGLPSSLCKLYLQNNLIERISTDQLHNLGLLQVLQLCGNHISLLPGGYYLPQLKSLCLGDKVIMSNIKPPHFKKIEILKLSAKRLKEPIMSNYLQETVSSLTTLTTLHLEYYKLTSLRFLINMKNLHKLILQNIKSTADNVEHFIPNVSALYIESSPQIVKLLLNITQPVLTLTNLSMKNNNVNVIDDIQSKTILKNVKILDLSLNPLNCSTEKWFWIIKRIRMWNSFLNNSEDTKCQSPVEVKGQTLLGVLNVSTIIYYEEVNITKTDNNANRYNFTALYGFLIFIVFFTVFLHVIALCNKFLDKLKTQFLRKLGTEGEHRSSINGSQSSFVYSQMDGITQIIVPDNQFELTNVSVTA